MADTEQDEKNVLEGLVHYGIFFIASLFLIVFNQQILSLGWLGSILQTILVFLATTFALKMFLGGQKYNDSQIPEEYKIITLIILALYCYYGAISAGTIKFPVSTNSFTGDLYLGLTLGFISDAFRRARLLLKK
ncbi:hypothetical protein HY989_04615 [Candidatus Micrarchaeota archaeon]|nr:hypothetical protein [Candidatus Micrarchaeota archaeon]